jgi:2-polyprenyl-3-methyl-5-hydroxy-6-metoxy-1,4-benzoquinol methylase
MTSPCPLCNENSKVILTREMRRGSGEAYYCNNCDHGFLPPSVSFNEKEYYSESYRKEYSHKSEAAETNARELFDTYKNYQSDRLKIIEPYLHTSSSLLEVGASAGQFLSHIKNKISKVNAIELDKDCCNFIKIEHNIDVDSCILRESKFAQEKYDIICAFQVMEHVKNPIDFLIDLKSVSKKGSFIFVEVPNIDDPLISVWDIKQYNKFYYHSAHLSYFSENSLKKVALSAGFLEENIQFKFIQDYNLLNHLNWILNQAPQGTCHTGLSEINLPGKNYEIANWLSLELQKLNNAYISRLVSAKATSNIMMVINV